MDVEDVFEGQIMNAICSDDVAAARMLMRAFHEDFFVAHPLNMMAGRCISSGFPSHKGFHQGHGHAGAMFPTPMASTPFNQPFFSLQPVRIQPSVEQKKESLQVQYHLTMEHPGPR